MKIVRYISICLLFTFIGSLLPTKAQDNPYKIDHSLYLLYEEATKHRNNATGLEIADTIYTKAIRINDKKAQCLALTIPVIYYFNNGKTELLEKAISRLQEISRKNNYLQYFFKQKTAYVILTCDWSSDVCSSDLNISMARD